MSWPVGDVAARTEDAAEAAGDPAGYEQGGGRMPARSRVADSPTPPGVNSMSSMRPSPPAILRSDGADTLGVPLLIEHIGLEWRLVLGNKDGDVRL